MLEIEFSLQSENLLPAFNNIHVYFDYTCWDINIRSMNSFSLESYYNSNCLLLYI